MNKVRLGSIVKTTSGATPLSYIKEYYENANIPWINSGEVGQYKINKAQKFISEKGFSNSNTKFIPKGSVLIAMYGATAGRTSLLNIDNATTNQAICSILPNENICNSFLKYKLDTLYNYLVGISSGSARDNLSQKTIQDLILDLPNLSTQQKIASVLSALDDKIELNNRINAELEAMAKTLYDYWFVQFDFPVLDALASTPFSQQSEAGRERNNVVERSRGYKSSGGKMVYNEILKREIPKGWEVTVFNDWIKNTKAGDWGKEIEEGNYTERVYCIRGADINGINGKGEVKAPERFILKNNSSKKLMPNDFVVEISGGSPVQSTGRIALITESTLERFDKDIICSNFCKAVSIKDEKYIYNFKQEWQRLYDAGVFFGFEGKTSGIKNFLFESFMNSYSIVLPQKEIVEKYYEFAQSIDKKIQSNLKQNQELSTLRDWLLPMLMNGQVKVEEREEKTLGITAKSHVSYNKSSLKNDDKLFEVWLKEEKLAARGDIDRATLRELFDAIDDEDKY